VRWEYSVAPGEGYVYDCGGLVTNEVEEAFGDDEAAEDVDFLCTSSGLALIIPK
jgi:hypothetical protein